MQTSKNSRIIDTSTPNYNQLNHIFRGFLNSARWLPKPIPTAREPLIYQHILDLFAPPRTLSSTVLIQDLKFKLSDCAALVLFETGLIDTVGGTTAFDLTRPETRDLFGAKA